MRKPANIVDKEPRSALIILTVLPYECADEVLSRRKGKRSRIAKGDQRFGLPLDQFLPYGVIPEG